MVGGKRGREEGKNKQESKHTPKDNFLFWTGKEKLVCHEKN